jgi:hypothetical protein
VRGTGDHRVLVAETIEQRGDALGSPCLTERGDGGERVPFWSIAALGVARRF